MPNNEIQKTTGQKSNKGQSSTEKGFVALLFISLGISILAPQAIAKYGYVGVIVSLIVLLIMKIAEKVKK